MLLVATMKACATRAACKGAANDQTDQTAIKINLLEGAVIHWTDDQGDYHINMVGVGDCELMDQSALCTFLSQSAIICNSDFLSDLVTPPANLQHSPHYKPPRISNTGYTVCLVGITEFAPSVTIEC